MAEAKNNGWTVISMKNDWKQIFAFEKNRTEFNRDNGDRKENSVSSAPSCSKNQTMKKPNKHFA
jgi:hypothetical protein